MAERERSRGEEGTRRGLEDGCGTAGGVRAAAGRRRRGRLRARHRLHVDHAAQDGGAPLQDDQQARQLRRLDIAGYVKAKELMLWPHVNEITVDDPPTGKVHFKSLAGVTKMFPVEAFAAGQ
ncbi:hypothetical protein ABZP36_013108 [Zizania latifolia]